MLRCNSSWEDDSGPVDAMIVSRVYRAIEPPRILKQLVARVVDGIIRESTGVVTARLSVYCY